MIKRAATMAIFLMIGTSSTALGSPSCMTEKEARAAYPKAHLYWHGRHRCWDDNSPHTRAEPKRRIETPLPRPKPPAADASGNKVQPIKLLPKLRYDPLRLPTLIEDAFAQAPTLRKADPLFTAETQAKLVKLTRYVPECEKALDAPKCMVPAVPVVQVASFGLPVLSLPEQTEPTIWSAGKSYRSLLAIFGTIIAIFVAYRLPSLLPTGGLRTVIMGLWRRLNDRLYQGYERLNLAFAAGRRKGALWRVRARTVEPHSSVQPVRWPDTPAGRAYWAGRGTDFRTLRANHPDDSALGAWARAISETDTATTSEDDAARERRSNRAGYRRGSLA